jgi:outer membrane receptor protein involved in Fe transport
MPASLLFCPGTRMRCMALGVLLACHFGALGAPAPAPTDLTTLPLEALLDMEVFSASRFAQKTSEAPSSVTVITAEEIRAYGWRTLADVVRSVRGLYVSYDRNYSYVGARGFQRPGDYNTRFLLLVDGNRINDAVYDQAPVGGEFPLELDLVERIEFVPGPGSSVYGSNALFGVINVITRSGRALPDTRVALEAGQFGMRKASASHAVRTEAGLGLLFGASRYSSSGQDQYYREFDTPDQNHGLARGLDYERGTRVYARASYGPFTVALLAADRVKGVPTASFEQTFDDPRSRTDDRQTYLSFGYRDFAGPHEELNLRLLSGRYDSIGDYIERDANRTLERDGSRARWWSGEVRVVSTRWNGHKIVAGADIERDTRLAQFAYDLAPYLLHLDDLRHGQRTGVYLQDEWALTPALLLDLGLRRDHNSGLAPVNSPRAALIWQLSPQSTFKAIHGKAFRAPNSYEKFYAFAGDGGQEANPALAEENVASSELVFVHQLGENARLTATAFRNAVGGLITLGENPAGGLARFDNAGPVRAHGMEFEYERRWRSGAMLRASYSMASVSEAQEMPGMPVAPVAPTRLGKLNLALPFAQRWHAGFEAQYVGQRHHGGETAAAFWLANLHLASARLPGGADLSVSIYNLFDKSYADPGAPEHRQPWLAQDGRSLRLGLSYAF